MRLRILSDLHVECFQEGRDLPDLVADVVILAGGIHRTTEGLAWAAEQFAGREIIYVPGNHEFYGTSMPDARSRLCPIFALSSNQRAGEERARVACRSLGLA